MATRHVFLHCPELEQWPYPAACPFNNSRAGRTRNALASMGMLVGPGKAVRPPVQATRKELESFHDPAYLAALWRASHREHSVEALTMGIGTPDCPVFDGMYDYATWAAGATLSGARLILQEAADTVFNPSGGYHHAHSRQAGGFCYVNDIVVACLELTAAGKRVAFLDIDVHHCDGVQTAFYARPDILTASLHEDGALLFPGTGAVEEVGTGQGQGYTINVPLPPATHDEAYLRAFRTAVLPVLVAYGPDVVVLEIGADALAGDPLAHLSLTNNVYADIISDIRSLRVPILATGGGGYHIENTVRAWSLAWVALCGEDTHHDDLAGMGGVMLQTTDWHAGLRDRVLAPSYEQRTAVDRAVNTVIAAVRRVVFPYHGLDPQAT